MKTLQQFAESPPQSVPTAVAWSLSEVAEKKGREELYTKQSPQKLKVLREHALVESAVSSNRIEGVEIDRDRVRDVVLGKPLFRDRNEEEVRGYRNALDWIHSKAESIAVNEETIRMLHRLCRGDIWDAGLFKEKDGDIIEKYPDGRMRIRFRPTAAAETPKAVEELNNYWHIVSKDAEIPALIAIAAYNLDFLCIHPFRDGNGRVSRLLLLLQLYHLTYGAGRYISIERLIEQNKDRYYETLELSSESWHEGRHDPWPYIGYVVYILKETYREFERRMGQLQSPKGAKSEMVQRVVKRQQHDFRIVEIHNECPGVSLDTVRKVLKNMRKKGEVQCLGRGQKARWRRIR